MQTTEQDTSFVRNPDGKGGFGDNPQNRNPGGWDKTQSISYQYNRLMRMTTDELAKFKPETVAQNIALKRVQAAETSLKDVQEITDRTEGKAPQVIDISNPDGSLSPYNALTAEELRKLAK